MTFVVAGVVLVLAFVSAVAAYLVIPHYQKIADGVGDEGNTGKTAAPAAAIAAFFRKENAKKLIFAVIMALVCAVSAYFVYGSRTATSVGVFDFCRQMCIALTLLAVMIIDSKTHLIPNAVLLITLGVGAVLLGLEFILSPDSAVDSLIKATAGMLLCLILFYLMALMTKEGMGMGDVKLIAVMGWLLGLVGTVLSVLVSLLMCSIFAIFLMVVKKESKTARVPFGPFMFFGYIFILMLFSL